jgi:hypothetical protein
MRLENFIFKTDLTTANAFVLDFFISFRKEGLRSSPASIMILLFVELIHEQTMIMRQQITA